MSTTRHVRSAPSALDGHSTRAARPARPASRTAAKAAPPTLAALPTLADRAYHALRDGILRGQFPPGTPLSRRRLARDLGMSVLPVTDALQRLQEAGLIETRARAGTRVRIPSEADVRELYELREALESQSARLFAERATAVERLEIRRLASQVDVLFNRLTTSDDDPELRFVVHSHHVQLHMRIAEHARSQLLQRMIDRNHILILNWLFDVTARQTPLPRDFHSQLAAVLTTGTPAEADAAMRAHIRYGLAEVSGRIQTLESVEWRERRSSAKPKKLKLTGANRIRHHRGPRR